MINQENFHLLPFEHANRIRISAAEGWLMLGAPDEADTELNELTGPDAVHSYVLALRSQVCLEAGWNEAGYIYAEKLCESIPDSEYAQVTFANAIRKFKGEEEALRHLETSLLKFQQSAVIHYNAACYAAVLGDFDKARVLLMTAFKLEEGRQFKIAAVFDPDLQAFWSKINPEGYFKISDSSSSEEA